MKKTIVKEIVANERKRKIRELYPVTSTAKKKPRNPVKEKWLLEQKEKMKGYEIGSI